MRYDIVLSIHERRDTKNKNLSNLTESIESNKTVLAALLGTMMYYILLPYDQSLNDDIFIHL